MVKAIDVHAHVFNLHYLPVAGILDGSAFADLPPWLARALAALALGATAKDPALDPDAPPQALLDGTLAGEIEELRARLEDFDSHIEAIEAAIPEGVWDDPDVQEALARVEAMEGVAEAIGGRRLRRLIRAARRWMGTASRRIDWVFAVATARERAIVGLLLRTYGDDVELFVHHMMDMKNHYRGGRTTYEFAPRQVARMERLSAMSGGRLATFVAWDPFRADSLDIVRDAITNHGCIGVKVYPPSGYRPWCNVEDPDRSPPRHVPAPSPELLDQRALDLFRWCAAPDRDLPVFTHCTPLGFQAYRGAGANGSPSYWRRLLEDNPDLKNLRLCFGHAGGDGWFASSDAGWDGSFAAQVAELCSDPGYPNLYCEVGILSEVSDPAARRRFAERLRAIDPGNGQLLTRLLYGSDWHMLYMEAGHEHFFHDYVALCDEAGFSASRKADFFRNNAVRYLKLGDAWLRQPA